MASNYDDVLQQLTAAGLHVDHLTIGKLTRCKVEGERDKRGWYHLHEMRLDNGDELVVGSYGVWQGTNNNATKVEIRNKAELSAEQREAMRKRLADDRRRAETARQAEASRAAKRAKKAWGRCSVSGACDYLERKGINAHGVRFSPSGALVIPMADANGRIHGLQVIRSSAQVKGGNGRKLSKEFFPAGLAMKGHFHQIGSVRPGVALLLAEGYATGASLYEATGLPVAVAFTANNLLPVAEALRHQYANAQIVVCADDDCFSEGNPGITAAKSAALAVGGQWVAPLFADQATRQAAFDSNGTKLTDFNDLHASEGLQVVAQQVFACVNRITPATELVDSTQPVNPGNKSKTARTGNKPIGHEFDPGQPPTDQDEHDPFLLNEQGVWHCGVDREGRAAAPMWICSALHVEARTRDPDSGTWGWLFVFHDPAGRQKTYAAPARMLAGDGQELRAILMSLGLSIAPTPRARALLSQYIQTRKPGTFATVTDQTGWHGKAYVTISETFGTTDDERILFQADTPMPDWFKVRGTLAQWQQAVAAACVGNARLMFAVCVALAGPALRPGGMGGGGFNIKGDSSTGKTTALLAAASVFGPPSSVQNWRNTANSLEAGATQRNDGFLPLDEMGQCDSAETGAAAYMLSNGVGKGRANQAGLARPRKTWRVMILSTGEVSLADHMQESGKRVRPGQEVRLVDIPADAGKGFGLFDTVHGFEGGAEFSRHINASAAAFHGAVGRAWLVWLTEHVDELKTRIRDATATLAMKMVPTASSGQVERVGERFALVGAAGEMATAAGLTGWPKGEAERAAIVCFNAWLAARGGTGSGEVAAMLRQVRRFLEAHGEGRFTWWHRAADDHSAKTLHRAGYRRMLNEHGEPVKSNSDHAQEFGDRMPTSAADKVTVEYFILAETFRSEVCQGFDPTSVCKVLADNNCLLPDRGRAYDCKPRLPGMGPTRCYRIAAQIFEIDV